jgi:hypothetical protein
MGLEPPYGTMFAKIFSWLSENFIAILKQTKEVAGTKHIFRSNYSASSAS